jgi:protein AaeX
MLREIALFGALVPSIVVYFFGSVLLYLLVDRLVSMLGLYRVVWHPPLVRIALFACLFSGLVLSTAP